LLYYEVNIMALEIGAGITIGGAITVQPEIPPDAPTIGLATATSATTATIAFTAPSYGGSSTITSYTATSNPGNITGTLNQSGSGTITVSGLTQSTSYTFTVTATNSVGTSSPSSASNSITTPSLVPTVIGQAFGGGYYAGKISTTGDGVATHYLIVAPKESGESQMWYTDAYYVAVSGTNSVIDGPTNTALYAAANSKNIAPIYAKNLNIGGYTDWYIPARNEGYTMFNFLKPNTGANETSFGSNANAVAPQPLNTNFSNVPQRPAQTTATAFQSGNSQQLPQYMWLSTQVNSDYMQSMTCANGGISQAAKNQGNRTVRAVRRIPV